MVTQTKKPAPARWPQRAGRWASSPAGLLALEVAFVVMFLAGVAMLYVPASLMLGGVAGAVATERQMARQAGVRPRGRGAER